ncbi:MAG: metallophosphoesterase [Clostridia bacterium]|nr:metallophosphoesterase [Clostridia bacterium]
MHYVLSDIHGNERRFHSILHQIDLRPEDTLYVLGDVIDRHPGGFRILRRLMAMPNAKLLLGNHEYMMLRALGHPADDNPDDGTALAHWPMEVWHGENRIGIDCGSGYPEHGENSRYGRLACLRLEDGRVFYSE